MNTTKAFSTDYWVAIEFKGKDAQDFLHRTTSQDFRNFQNDENRPGAFLTGTGGVIATFTATKINEILYLITAKSSQEKTLQQIDKLHFGEDLQYAVSSTITVVESFDQIWKMQWGEIDKISAHIRELEKNHFKKMSSDQWQELKTFNFHPQDQVDLTESNIVLEAGLENFVHRNKGCYPGQEVVERIYTYGNIPRKFVQLESSTALNFGDLFVDGQKVGRVTSIAQQGQTFVANGYLLRAKSQVGSEVEVQNADSRQHARVIKVSPDLNKDAPT